MTTLPMIHNVPCTLVTGFLGAGKTTVVNHLLSSKPMAARWALLINEFGHVGIDGTILADDNPQASTIAIREVSGGCICCTSQLPLQIAITRLLSEHRPERLIIEPTGMAHPDELTTQLSAPHWQTALSMRAVITVLSAVQWQQEKYRSHQGFQAHVCHADAVVINRYESLSADDRQQLITWVMGLNASAVLIWAQTEPQTDTDGNTPVKTVKPAASYLNALTAYLSQPSAVITRQRAADSLQSRISLTPPAHLMTSAPHPIAAANSDDHKNDLPYRYHDNQQGMLIYGWKLPPYWVLSADTLQQWLLAQPNWQRIKGVVHTTEGWLKINFTPDSLSTHSAGEQVDSRLEIIALLPDPDLSNAHHAISDAWHIADDELMGMVTE